MIAKYWCNGIAICLGLSLSSAWAQAVNVIEYYNKPLDAYFITGRVNEQAALDAQPSFERTGMSFQAVAAVGAPASMTRICRFYINTTTPFASTHFYGREGIDCESIRALNLAGFAWEDYDFALQQPVSGTCPTGTTSVYRSFRPAGGGKTANHRYSTSPDSYIAMANSGYKGEQDAFCATAVTDVTFPAAGNCGTLYYQRVRVGYESRTSTGATELFERFHSASTVTFNGVTAVPVVERTAAGENVTLAIQETAIDWRDLGSSTITTSGSTDLIYTPATVYPRRMSIGQRISINRQVTFNPALSTGAWTQAGSFTYTGRESVTVALGTYDACKFSSELTTTFGTGRTDVTRATIWVAADVGIVKSTTQVTSTTGAASTSVTTDVAAITLRPL